MDVFVSVRPALHWESPVLAVVYGLYRYSIHFSSPSFVIKQPFLVKGKEGE